MQEEGQAESIENGSKAMLITRPKITKGRDLTINCHIPPGHTMRSLLAELINGLPPRSAFTRSLAQQHTELVASFTLYKTL